MTYQVLPETEFLTDQAISVSTNGVKPLSREEAVAQYLRMHCGPNATEKQQILHRAAVAGTVTDAMFRQLFVELTFADGSSGDGGAPSNERLSLLTGMTERSVKRNHAKMREIGLAAPEQRRKHAPSVRSFSPLPTAKILNSVLNPEVTEMSLVDSEGTQMSLLGSKSDSDVTCEPFSRVISVTPPLTKKQKEKTNYTTRARGGVVDNFFPPRVVVEEAASESPQNALPSAQVAACETSPQPPSPSLKDRVLSPTPIPWRATGPQLQGLRDELFSAAGSSLNVGSVGLEVMSEPSRWIAAGCDMELDILPVIRARAAQMAARGVVSRISSWGYFSSAVFDARNVRLAPPPAVETPASPQPRQFVSFAEQERQKKIKDNEGFWEMMDKLKSEGFFGPEGAVV